MKRRTRASAGTGAAAGATAASGDDEDVPVQQPVASSSVSHPSVADDNGDMEGVESTQLAVASQAAPPALSGPGTARVTRERALFFATGERTSPSRSTQSQRARRGAAAQDGEPKESWPGYFSTARDLDENRLAAQAARQEELQRKEHENAAQARVVWVPRKKPRTTVLARENLVPSLQELTLQCLAKHIELMPTLEYIDAAARAQVAHAVVKLRRMKSEVLPLFIFPGVTEIDIPDCSNIDEGSFVHALKACLQHGLSLTALRLGLCGRCIADDAILSLGDSLRAVEQLRMQGCYRLSDAGCEALVRRCAPSLREFELSCNQRITKHSIDCFSELQHLHALTLSECPQLDDTALRALKNMTKLRKLSLHQMEQISDAFVSDLVQCLPDLEELSLARCSQLTDKAVHAVFAHCRRLQSIDFSDLPLLTDASFEGVRTHGIALRRVAIRGCLGLTDDAIAYVAIGANKYLEVLEMSSLAETTDVTLQVLQDYCASNLQVLDLSFCRKMSEDALGVFTDECEALRSLVLWGCTQITARFLTCHSRNELLVTGHPLLTGLTIKY